MYEILGYKPGDLSQLWDFITQLLQPVEWIHIVIQIEFQTNLFNIQSILIINLFKIKV